MTALNLLLAAGVGAIVGAAFYVIDYVVGDDIPTFWWGLLHDWTTGFGLLALVGIVIAWAAGAVPAWHILAFALGFFGAEVGAYVVAVFFGIASAAWGLVPDFLKPQAP